MSETSTGEGKNRLRLIFVVAVLIGASILLFATEWASCSRPKPPGTQDPAPSNSGAAVPRIQDDGVTASLPLRIDVGPTAVRAFAATPNAPSSPREDEQSPLADSLNAAMGTAHADLVIVANLFSYYLEQFRELPVGNNAEITAALAGDNPHGYAVLPPHHAAINASGELTDRWGAPYLFHQLAGDTIEIRSAGPDQRRFTADDLVWPESVATADLATLADAGVR